jgi:hypothetical protein
MFKDWKTTVLALIPLLAYGLKLAGVWPDSIPLPPLDQIWPSLLAVVGVGVAAKDSGS